MGSGSSSPKGGDGGVVGVEGGAVFQQRPVHCRLEGRSEKEGGEEFTDISYSDLGFIITPQTKKLTINNNYKSSLESTSSNPSQSSSITSRAPSSTGSYQDHDCDIVSSEVDSGNVGSSSTSCSNSSNSNSVSEVTLQHRTSNSSFTMSQLPGAASRDPPSPKNLDDLRLEEITS
ncbi:hypothetical protein Pmani_013960 [Petrolisthes manimaculis]|uniref:Uncharacterized protein n=2 Tax=Petrolisthes TaxID=84661 RepID=A0AAE1PWH3_9EUCA|nr:hypothetical protein Pcinc_015004 [Petrolisthes cinctipes]KAK4314759.1 hypothetical protein Pmani_013960 [Petrolisthes manimaculis]